MLVAMIVKLETLTLDILLLATGDEDKIVQTVLLREGKNA